MTRILLPLGASLLALGTAFAQDAAQDDYTDECLDLFSFLDASPDYVPEDEPELLALIERDDPAACTRRLAQLERQSRQAASETRTTQDVEREVTTETETVQERIQLEEVVTVQGDVDVAVGVPNVQVVPSPADVRVTGEAPRVTVRQSAPQIVVKEQPATIIVGMPTITIEQEAPEIVITMPEPGVDVAMAEPRVEVRQAPPRIVVAVPDPRVDLDLRAVAGEANGEPVRTRITRERGAAEAQDGLRLVERGEEGADANVYVGETAPRVSIAGLDEEADITVESAEPEVRFERAEPTVRMAGEPKIRFERRGEPSVRIVTQGEAARPQRLAGPEEQTDRSEGSEPAPDRRERPQSPEPAQERATATPPQPEGTTFAVSDLRNRTVYGANGEELGSIERVTRVGRETYAIVEHGGFLGLGDTDIPVPVSRLAVRDGNIVATDLTKAAAEDMEAEDMREGTDLDGDATVRLGR